jgi:hypothetical protein
VRPISASFSPLARSSRFHHYGDPAAAAPAATPADPGLTPHKVKTQTIHPDSKPMIDDLAKASGLPAKDLPTAKTTEQNLIDEGARAGVTNMNQYAYELATSKRESRMGNTMNEGGGDAYFERNWPSGSSSVAVPRRGRDAVSVL